MGCGIIPLLRHMGHRRCHAVIPKDASGGSPLRASQSAGVPAYHTNECGIPSRKGEPIRKPESIRHILLRSMPPTGGSRFRSAMTRRDRRRKATYTPTECCTGTDGVGGCTFRVVTDSPLPRSRERGGVGHPPLGCPVVKESPGGRGRFEHHSFSFPTSAPVTSAVVGRWGVGPGVEC